MLFSVEFYKTLPTISLFFQGTIIGLHLRFAQGYSCRCAKPQRQVRDIAKESSDCKEADLVYILKWQRVEKKPMLSANVSVKVIY